MNGLKPKTVAQSYIKARKEESANGTCGDTYGVHGNNNESSIGKYVSQGWVRMHNADIEKLYDKVQVGTPVAITYSYKSLVDLTNVYGYKFKGYKLKNN
ncbi:hypothetical protein PMEGAS228_33520 [Priestia megaterium]